MTTSSAALRHARGSGITAEQQRKILNAISAAGIATRNEIEALTGIRINVVCPRVHELKAIDLLYVVDSDGLCSDGTPGCQRLAITDKGREWLGSKQ
ncbi:MAG: hypothetical protein U9Q35_01075 [Pseudomonadota bacterium]|nr:hypothetical protein [Pseudomonadota bacterium]